MRKQSLDCLISFFQIHIPHFDNHVRSMCTRFFCWVFSFSNEMVALAKAYQEESGYNRLAIGQFGRIWNVNFSQTTFSYA